MLGLTLAWRLAARGHKVTVFEAAPALGGLTASFSLGALYWDRYYHVIDAGDLELLNLLGELGLAQAVEWRRTRTLFFDGHALYPLDNGLDYLRLPALAALTKLRVALTIALGARFGSAAALESMSAAQWLTRWSGRKGYDGLWRPLLRSKLGANYDQISAAYIWAVIRRFYGARRGAAQTEHFGYMPGGYARILATFSERLAAAGVQIKTGAAVRAVTRAADGRPAIALENETLAFDRVVLTCAAPQAARLCVALPDAERTQHAKLRYQGVVCLSLLLRRPLGGGYMTYITDETIPFTTVIEMTALTGSAAFDGHHLAYLPKYLPSDDALFAADDETLRAQFVGALARMYPDFKETDIVAWRVARAPYVLALPSLHYSRNLPAIATSQRGLYILNSAQIRNAALNVSESVVLANTALAELEA